MIIRTFIACLACLIALPVVALDNVSPEQENPITAIPSGKTVDKPTAVQVEKAKKMYARRRAELENKLKVEQVLLGRTGEKGVEIEVTYRIIDAEGYAAHPKTTFVADEASSKLVPLTKLHKLFTPMPAVEANKLPPASLTLWDKHGVIKPGQPVTVVVAGYGQKHVLPEAGPDYGPAMTVAAAVQERSALASPDAVLDVHEIKTVAQGHLLKVSYSSKGIKALDPSDNQTYVENPETGNRHPVAKVPRIGALAPKDIEGVAGTYMVIDNAGESIKPGQHVNVVVSGVKAENILVVGE